MVCSLVFTLEILEGATDSRQNYIRAQGEGTQRHAGAVVNYENLPEASVIWLATLENAGPVLSDPWIFLGKLENQILLWNTGNYV